MLVRSGAHGQERILKKSLVQKVEFIIAWGQDPGRQKEMPPVRGAVRNGWLDTRKVGEVRRKGSV